jgi:glycerol-3-phosphate dehydrogenase
MVLTGLTLFGEESKQEAKNISFGKRSRIIDHFKENKIEGLVTLLGVRATTARGMAEKTVDLIFSKLSKRIKKSMTCMTPIYGGNINIFEDYYGRAIKEDTFNIDSQTMQALIHNYGSQYKEVTKYLTENPSWAETLGNSTVLKGEIIHAIRDEMASKLADVVLRRTDLGTSGDPGDKALKDCAEIMKNELSWNDGKVLDEIEEVSNFFEKRGFINKPL